MHETLIELKLCGFKYSMMILLMMEERVLKKKQKTDEPENLVYFKLDFGDVSKKRKHSL